MKRRDFLKTSSLVALGVSAFGYISWDGENFVGNNKTTSDILGPYYRPNAPMRRNLVPPGVRGKLTTLRGAVYEADGVTLLKNALVEAWQCDEDHNYDNTSDEFKFRGALRTNEEGEYFFQTILPPPYLVFGNWRPSHIHLRISHQQYQDLITQIYFQDDPYLEKDPSSSSPYAKSRILDIKENSQGEQEIDFDLVMSKDVTLNKAAFNKLSGLYQLEGATAEFYRQNNLLMLKLNGQILEGLAFKGNNLFEAANGVNKAQFSVDEKGDVHVEIFLWDYPQASEGKMAFKGTKFIKY